MRRSSSLWSLLQGTCMISRKYHPYRHPYRYRCATVHLLVACLVKCAARQAFVTQANSCHIYPSATLHCSSQWHVRSSKRCVNVLPLVPCCSATGPGFADSQTFSKPCASLPRSCCNLMYAKLTSVATLIAAFLQSGLMTQPDRI